MEIKQKISSDQVNPAIVYTVDSYEEGVSFGRTMVSSPTDWRDELHLKIEDEQDLLRFRRRFSLDQQNNFSKLEVELMNLSRKGLLSRSHIVLGTTTDPFLPFEQKFDSSMKFLTLFQRYTPGLLTVQTRSPLIVIAMPVLAKLGKRASVTMGIETLDEEAVRLYTPGLPRASERLKAARALRNFGVQVTIQVAPVLPYGDWKKDVANFAEELIDSADFIYVRPLFDGTDGTNHKIRSKHVSKTMARDKKYHWLRPDSANPLITTLEVLAPQKLKLPEPAHLQERQVKMFAA